MYTFLRPGFPLLPICPYFVYTASLLYGKHKSSKTKISERLLQEAWNEIEILEKRWLLLHFSCIPNIWTLRVNSDATNVYAKCVLMAGLPCRSEKLEHFLVGWTDDYETKICTICTERPTMKLPVMLFSIFPQITWFTACTDHDGQTSIYIQSRSQNRNVDTLLLKVFEFKYYIVYWTTSSTTQLTQCHALKLRWWRRPLRTVLSWHRFYKAVPEE